MGVVSPQTELFAQPRPPSGTVFVNDRVCLQTEEKQRVVFVQGVVFAHYSIEDRPAEAYAMVQLFESGYADQNDIARCFGVLGLAQDFLEAIRCLKRSTLGKGNAHEERQTRGCGGSVDFLVRLRPAKQRP